MAMLWYYVDQSKLYLIGSLRANELNFTLELPHFNALWRSSDRFPAHRSFEISRY